MRQSRPRPRSGPERAVERRRENIEIFLGVLGFFTFLLLVATTLAELRGEPSLARAVALAVFVGLFYAVLRIRRALVQQQAALRHGTTTGPDARG